MIPSVMKAYNLGRINSDMLQNVLREISEKASVAMSSKEMQTIDVFFRGPRVDVSLGQIHILPPSICNNNLEKFPRPLLRGFLRPLDQIDSFAKLHMSSNDMEPIQLVESELDTPSKEDIKAFKEIIFPRGTNGQFRPIMIFIPSWCSADELVFAPIVSDENIMKHHVLTLMFKTFYNPSLSALLSVATEGPIGTGIPKESFGAIFKADPETADWPLKTAKTKRARVIFSGGTLKEAKEALTELTEEEEEVIGAVVNSLQVPTEKKAFIFTPGQVLREYYPESLNDMLEYPMDIGDGAQEALPTVLNSESDECPSKIIAPKPTFVQETVPLRQEMGLRGPGFVNEFYRNYTDINPIMIASKKKMAAVDKKQAASEFLKLVCGSIATALMGGFHLTSKLPIAQSIPSTSTVDLSTFVPVSSYLPSIDGQALFSAQLKEMFQGSNDGDIKEFLDNAWAQASIWNSSEDGFVWEILVRAEALDVDTLTLTYRVIINKK